MRKFRNGVIILASLIAAVQVVLLSRAGWFGQEQVGNYLGLAGMVLLILAMLFSQRHARRARASSGEKAPQAED
jgi:uncharacterized membrane protein